MQIEVSSSVEKIIQELIASGQFATAAEAVNAIVLRSALAQSPDNTPDAPPNETPYLKAVRLGLLGAARDLPADLSSNPQHMERFGRS